MSEQDVEVWTLTYYGVDDHAAPAGATVVFWTEQECYESLRNNLLSTCDMDDEDAINAATNDELRAMYEADADGDVAVEVMAHRLVKPDLSSPDAVEKFLESR